jgi:5-methylcytosine-specific restriction endonuclease McrA
VHRLEEYDPILRYGICSECGRVRIVRTKGGAFRCSKQPRGGLLSSPRRQKKWNGTPGTIADYKRFKGDHCERCNFEPEDPCQLDVDHINGDHGDNRPENLQTLCSNCHRLKTKRTAQGLYSVNFLPPWQRSVL